MTACNAEHAGAATECTKEASRIIGEANAVLHRMMESVNEISNSSRRISKIIKVIEDIAFQTNILALNAAIEAARAGVTQQLAATAQESAASGMELNSHAGGMDEIANNLRLLFSTTSETAPVTEAIAAPAARPSASFHPVPSRDNDFMKPAFSMAGAGANPKSIIPLDRDFEGC